MLRDRDIRRVVVARFLSRMSGEAAFFVGIWGKAAFTLHATAGQIALLMGVLSVSSIVGTAVAGVLIDRYDPRRVLAGAEFVFVPVALLFLLPRELWQLTVLVGFFGFFGAPIVTAGASFAPFLAKDREGLTKVNALIDGAGSLSFVLGPAIGALLVRFASIDWVFIFDAATSVIAVLLMMGVHIRRPERAAGERRGAFAELREGLRFSYSKRGLRYFILIGTATWLGFGAFGALEPLFYRDVLRTGVEAIGWVNTLFGVGILLGAWVLAKLPDRLVSAKGLAGGAVLVGLGALLYVGTRDIRIVAVGAVAWGAIIGVVDPLLRTLVHADSPDEYVGRVTGVAQMHRQGGELLPLAFAPLVAATIGVQATLIGGGLVLAVVALLSIPEAIAVDRGRPTGPIHREQLSADDQPVSPNP
jgi:DHA3 family macrolide efflux protein-like MFS transporter